MEILYNAVKNIILFLILLAIIQNLVGKSGYRQYINIFAGMVLILIVVMPIMDLFHVTDKLTYYFDLNQFKAGTKGISGKMSEAEASTNQKIIQEYKEQIVDEVKIKLSNHNVTATSIKLELEMDQKKDSYGRVKKLVIYGKQQKSGSKKSSQNDDVSAVDKVAIDHIKLNEVQVDDSESDQTEDDIKYDTVLELNVKEDLAGYLNVSIDCIEVEIKS
ncbi:stage III sporulation protein AF [Lachnospiraceae bacterium KM106-2]|nr:stage III sporulation protein AF [Lachnospiraceae bacterium KM106-2]